MPLCPERLPDAYRQMLVIRKFEETIVSLYQEGKIRGSFHPCVGQEATAVGGCWAIRRDDPMTCTYRGHGQALAKGLDVGAAMAEMLGKATGCCKGKGGSMHFTDPAIGLLGANAIVAGGIPHAAGAALAAKLQGRDNVALTYFGEGAVNQGVFHETLNLAAVWQLPLILLCENNLYSEMTPSHETSSVSEMTRRDEAYNIPSARIDGNDVEAVFACVEEAAARARAGGGPTFIEAMTYRLWGHMMGDPEVYRTKQEVAAARDVEPITRLDQRLSQLGHSPAELARLEAEAQAIVTQAVQFAEASPAPSPASAFEDVFA
jgi:TPP-dependent pyruvate/acetoin dehydrogenase alpha subunit